VGALGRGRACVPRRHVQVEAELVDVEDTRRIDALDCLLEDLTLLLNLGPIPFSGVLRFFFG
jgi:hypothetical protein